MTSEQTNAFVAGAGFSPTLVSHLLVWLTLGAFYGLCGWIVLSELQCWATGHTSSDQFVGRVLLVAALTIFFSTLM